VGDITKCILEHYERMLRVLQQYFTCEGRFDRVYIYHIRIIMHFIGKNPLNLPFYLYISLGKMADMVQSRADKLKSSLFHFSLVKLLVVEEIKKSNIDSDYFLTSTNISPDCKGDTPSCTKKVASRISSEKEQGSTE
jgi:hypothetical protein